VPYDSKPKNSYNVKIEYYVRGLVPTIAIKAYDVTNDDVLYLQTINKNYIKRIIRICNQHSDRMVKNQLETLIQVCSSKLTVGRTLKLNFERLHVK